MNFFKKLFSKEKPQEEAYQPYISAPTQQGSRLEPIVIQALESLYPNIEDQKRAIAYSAKFREKYPKDMPRLLLALLSYSEGDIEKLARASEGVFHFIVDDVDPIFPSIEDAEKWVKSLSKSQG